MSECYLYWIFDKNCTDPQTCGYVGITKNIPSRMRNHRKKFSEKEWEYTILYEGSRDECLKLEFGLRPTQKIGWNIAYGGNTRGCGGSKKGISKGSYSDEHRAAISCGLKGRAYSHKGKRNPKNAQRQLGLKHSEQWNENIRKSNTPEVRAAKGAYNKGRMKIRTQCGKCKKQFAPHIISRFHGEKCRVS